MKAAFLALLAGSVAFCAGGADTRERLAITMDVDAGVRVGEMKPIWRFFGADEPNFATMKDGRRLLSELGALRPKQVYFRTHNLLTTGNGTPALKWGSTNVYTEDSAGRPIYDWRIVDSIFDGCLARGVKPLVEVGFMPEALSTHPQPYQHDWRPGNGELFTGWTYPPKDYDKWRELVYQWTRHCVERYGKAEVESWYWEVWNEPNIGYWHGTPEEWYKLHDYAIDGIRRALPTARVGGPHAAGDGGAFMDGFLHHITEGTNFATGGKGTPEDFVAFHAKGAPHFVDGHVQLGIADQLRTIDAGFARIAAVPALKGKPIILGESDPDGCAACQGPQLGYRTGTMYSSYTAASIAREYVLADRRGVNLEGAVTWAFEFEDQPYFAGQRVLATAGIDLPVLNVFRLFSFMGGDRVKAVSSGEVPLDALLREGVRQRADVATLASLEEKRLYVLAWHYHDDDVLGAAAAVRLQLTHLPLQSGVAAVTQFSVDEAHANAFAVWKKMGSPLAPNNEQYRELVAAGQLTPVEDAPKSARVEKGSATVEFVLSRQAVTLWIFDLAGKSGQ